MNLSKLIHEIWKDSKVRDAKLRKDEVELIVKVLIDQLVKSLFIYGKIKMQGLFTLELRKSKGREIVNPHTGEKMRSENHYRLGIRPSKRVKDGLREKSKELN